MPCWVAIAPLMDSTTGWRDTEFTGRHPKTIRSPHRSITSAKAVKGSIVGHRGRSRWQFPCVASGSDREFQTDPLPKRLLQREGLFDLRGRHVGILAVLEKARALMLAHEVDERRCVRLPVNGKPFELLEDRIDPSRLEQLN